MYQSSRNPAWFTDGKWVSGILLAGLTLFAALSFVFSRATSPAQVQPVMERILELTLLPDGETVQPVAVREESSYQAGEPLELLPGTGVLADLTEIPVFTVQEAGNRLAGVMTDAIVTSGTQEVLEQVRGSPLSAQLQAAASGPVRQLITAQLGAALLPAGLDNGSRLADWPLQARQRPGQQVQPIVGVFVLADPLELEQLSAAGIGELVVAGLADSLLTEGAAAAREMVSNANLLARLDEAIAGPIRTSLHGLLATVLLGHYPEIEERLAEAQAALRSADSAASVAAGPAATLGADLEGLSTAEANELVVTRLARHAQLEGSNGVLSVVSDPGQIQRTELVSGVLDALSAQANAVYRRSAWLYGSAAVIVALLLAFFSQGWGRLLNPGIAIVLAAGGGALLSRWFVSTQQELGRVRLPVSAAEEGAFGHVQSLLQFLLASAPAGALAGVARDWLLVTAIGAALIVLGVLGWLWQLLKPRRRSLL